MRSTRLVRTFSVAAALSMATSVASAHHSFAMFDNSKTVKLDGTVKEFQWTNPHGWVELMVIDPATGRPQQISIETGSPNMLARQGWSRTSLKVGEPATIFMHPLKSGALGGSLAYAIVNGVRVGEQH